ncbi:MAG: hypothetical protein QXU33_05875 [Candidatus Methanomethyliaceae archaeon]
MSDLEIEAKSLIERIANDVRPIATEKRIQKSIQLLLGIFPPEHVITELLQNADDVGANTAVIEMTDEGIFFSHNGCDFNEAHLRALCDVGETTKKPGVQIGFMGIGFKSVFKISDNPQVFSGPYRFYFTREEAIIPRWLDEIPQEVKGRLQKGFTTFFLPYRKNFPNETIAFLKETVLTKLEPICLVFLKNIEEIKIKCHTNTRVLRTAKGAHNNESIYKKSVSVTEIMDGKERTFNYLIFNKTLEVPEHVKCDNRAKDSGRASLTTTVATIAFSMQEGSVKPEKYKLYTFLPTPFETGLRFAVNCDFLLNTQRTEIDFVSGWNIWLLESIGNFLEEIVQEFLRDEKQKLSFYDVLPRRGEVSERLFTKIAEPLIEYMKDNPSVITSDGDLAKPTEVVLASEEVQKIIPPEKAGAQHYADPKIQGRAFLKEELGIRDLTGKEESRFVLEVLRDEKWLASLDATQVRTIYEFLYRKLYGEEKNLWELTWFEKNDLEKILKNMKLVRSTSGLYHKAEETIIHERIIQEKEGQASELTSIPCLIFVDPGVLSDQSRELLKKLGARDFNEESVASRILDSQAKGEWKDWTNEERLTSIVYIAKWLGKMDYEAPRDIKPKLGDLVLPTEGGGWAKAATCYVPTSELKEILLGANYVDLSIISGPVANAERFLKTIGVLNFPRVLQLGERKRRGDTPPGVSKENWEAYWSWLYDNHYIEHNKEETISTISLDGFDECVATQNALKLTTYLNFLLKDWEEYYKLHENSTYHWFHYLPKSKSVPSYFIYQLKMHKWLPTTEGLARPREVFAPLREIKRVGGSLIPYLKISEEQARQKKEFLQFLGIETEISLRMLLSVLSKARDVEVNDDLKAQLERVYQKIATLCEDEKIEEQVYILDRKGSFQNSKTLYWLDDPEAERVFGDEVPAAWVPLNMPRHQLEALFNALGVVSISSILERERICDCQEAVEDAELTDEIRKRRDYLYSVLLHHKAGRIEAFPDFIRKAVVVKVDQLRVALKALDKVHEIEVPAFCSMEEGKIYVSSNAEITDIARELARAFKAPTGSEFTLSFVLIQTPDTILEQLRRSSIQLMWLPEPMKPEAILGVEPEMPERIVTREPEPMVNAHQKLPKDVTIGPPPSTTSAQEVRTVPEVPVDHNKDFLKEVEDMKRLITEKISTTESSEVWRERVEIEYNKNEIERDIKGALQQLNQGKSSSTEATDVWVEHRQIDRVTSVKRVVVTPFVSFSSEKNWEPRTLEGEKVFIQSDMDPAKIDAVRLSIKPFRERMKKIIEIMGGNPDTVNVCIANPETDGDRREGQLFFNVLRNDKPLRWIVVAARELAYVKFPKPSQAHISLMADLIEKALERIEEIYPEIFRPKG